MLNTDPIKGIIVPIVTPVDKDERLDETRLRFMVDHVIEGGVHGILAFGSNGEFYMFEENELQRGLEVILEQSHELVPVFFGIGAIRTRNAVRLAKMAEATGADGVSILPPMFIKPSSEELFIHFKTVAEAIPDTPVLLYNNPGRIGYSMSADLVESLARNVENIVGIKDSSGDFTLLSEYIRRTRDIGFKVLAGKDTLVYAGLCTGTVGSVCSTANMFAPLVTSIYTKFVAGDLEGALEAQFRLNPVRISQDKAGFPAATKDMANILGLDVGNPVKPSLRSEDGLLDYMKKYMQEAELLD
ncbi:MULTISPECIES: dihydrodipicolinate synthase family protein [unclassified Paenibacillus]|uniref:dihydrodipicolinate synthase family protein n=1 Tax=unclassified Paenibacillus TaxID=185978 RepID=UPI000837E3F1|nr:MULTISPECIES: dihydrodipicolinate synthase family protein [unclassified Paenibacillus]NWL90315.1 dihydrodipicolinate synthase family protein [Paenibacillus sp. 79R4]